MISTVTTSTVSTITTATLAGSIALIGMFVLFTLLIQKEIANTAVTSRLRTLRKVLNIGIIPLLFAFSFIVVTRLLEIFR
jgi:hypothetical protein